MNYVKWKKLILLFSAIILLCVAGGCAQIRYHVVYNNDGTPIERTVIYQPPFGSTQRDNVCAVIGDPTHPEATLFVSRSVVDMGEFYKMLDPAFFEFLKMIAVSRQESLQDE